MIPTRRARSRMRSLLSAAAAFVLLAILPLSVAAADTTAPSLTSPVLSASTVNQGVPVSVSTVATDASGIISAEVRIDGGAWTMMSPGFGSDVTTTRNARALVNTGVAQVQAGSGFSCAVMGGGSVRCWGGNGSGQLGDGTTTSSSFPVAVTGISSATAVTTGEAHACARLANSTIKCWGANGHGQLGDGSTSPSPTPVLASGITTAVGVAVGANHSCAVLADRTVRCWGYNNFGQVGGSSATDVPAPVAVPGITTATAVTAGNEHACALLAAGSVRCWGYNALGQLGNGTTDGGTTPVAVSGITTATAISAGGNSSCARLSTSTVRCWGANHFGEVGDGTNTDRHSPANVSGITTATTVSVGASHACARLSNGSLRCWGENGNGQLGDGTATARSTPVTVTGLGSVTSVSAGARHTCARLSDATVRCWGLDDQGQLGYSGFGNWSKTPVTVSGISTATAIGAGVWHTCARLFNSTVRCWGRNNTSQLGDGTSADASLVPVVVPGITTATAVGAGRYSSCALLADKSVRCWGSNENGQLGDGTNFGTGTPVTVSGITTATMISVGDFHACARLADSTVWCWGRNYAGVLGDGTTFDRSTPVKVYGIANALSVGAGQFNTCVVLSDHTVKCWGTNGLGELGNGTSNGSVTPVAVSGISTATAVSVGDQFACALLADQTVKCWGSVLGNGSGFTSSTPVTVAAINTATSITAGSGHACALLADSTIRCWGDNGDGDFGPGQLGNGTTATADAPVAVLGIDSATNVEAGGGHTCARLATSTIRCWGDNRDSQLGTTLTATAADKRPLDGVIGTLAAGIHQICVRATDATGNVSAGTACATLTVLDKTAPTATAPKTELRSGVALSGTQLRVRYSWTAADNAGGSGVDHYELAKSTDGGTTWVSYSTVVTSTAATASVASTGTLRVRVRAFDKAGNVGAWATGPLLTPRLVEETSAGISYTGTWSTSTSTGYSGGTARASNAAGASATYTFTGSSVALVTTTGPTRGAAKIYVDGILITTLDTYSATAAAQVQTWARSWTTAGTHTLKVVIVGTVGRPRFDLDAFAVLEGVAPPAPPPVTGGPGPTQPATAADLAGATGDDGGAAPSIFGLTLILGLVVLGLILPRSRAVRRGRR